MFLSMKAKKAFSTTLVDILPQIGTEMRVVGLKKTHIFGYNQAVKIKKRKVKIVFSTPKSSIGISIWRASIFED